MMLLILAGMLYRHLQDLQDIRTKKSQDAMTYITMFGRPDLFITFTCNPEWPEIKKELLPDQKSYDRHDLVSRVFHLKLKKMKDLLMNKHIFGPTRAFVYCVERQKRASRPRFIMAGKQNTTRL